MLELSKRAAELFCLPQDARKCANLYLAVTRNDASRSAATQDDMTAALPHDAKAQTFPRPPLPRRKHEGA